MENSPLCELIPRVLRDNVLTMWSFVWVWLTEMDFRPRVTLSQARFLLERAFFLDDAKGIAMNMTICTHLYRGGVSRSIMVWVLAAVMLLAVAWPLAARAAEPAPPAEATQTDESTQPASANTPAEPLSYEALAATLEDPAERDKLIAQLRALAEAQAGSGDAVADGRAAPPGLEPPSGIAVLSQRLGGALQATTAQLSRDIQQTLQAFSRVGSSTGVTDG